MPRSLYVLATLPLFSCDGGVVLENGRPRITFVASAPVDGRASLTLWVADPEGDAVDVTLAWSQGTQSGPVVLAPASPPRLGLPTELGLNDDAGQPHRLLWLLDEVPEGPLELELTVDDRPHAGDAGDSYRVTGLDPRAQVAPIAAALVD
jgi:hypothetical protein